MTNSEIKLTSLNNCDNETDYSQDQKVESIH